MNNFFITKAQNKILRDIRDGKVISLATNLDELKYSFFIEDVPHQINRQVMLVCMRRQLIRFNYKLLKFSLTKLGEKLANIQSDSTRMRVTFVTQNKVVARR